MQRCTTYGRAEARQVGWDTIPLACFLGGNRSGFQTGLWDRNRSTMYLMEKLQEELSQDVVVVLFDG